MPSTEKLTRLGIFLATGYLCAGIVVAIFVGLPLWVNFFSSEFYVGALITIVTMLVAAVIGIVIMRALVSRYGLKPIFDMDVLILMIGVLFLALAMNQAMVVVGLLVAIGGGTLYFIENFSMQMKAASQGGTKALSLVGWALGPIIAVAALTIYGEHGLLTLRILLAHYIVIAFWVWVQRLSLHEDYAEAPEFLHRMYETYQRVSAIRAEQDLEIKKNRFAKFTDKLKAPEPKAVPEPKPAAPKDSPVAETKVETKPEAKTESKPQAPKAQAEEIGLSVESVLGTKKTEDKPAAPVKPAEESKPEAPKAEEPKAESKAEEKPAQEPKAEPEAPKAEEVKPAQEPKAEPEAPKAEEVKPAEEPKNEPEAPKAEEKPAEEKAAEENKAEAAAPAPQKKKKGWLW